MATSPETVLRLLDLMGPQQTLSEADWRALGFLEPTRILEGLGRLRARVDTAKALETGLGEVLRAVLQTCDPDQAFSGLERWLEAGGAAHFQSPLAWVQEPFLGVLCTLFAGTPAFSEYLIRFPQRTQAVLDPVVSRTMRGGRQWFERIQAGLAAQPTWAEQLAALRRLHRESLLQIAALDLTLASSLPHTIRALSDLADACTDSAVRMCVERLRPQLGLPRPAAALSAAGQREEGAFPIPFVVLGLGKLGGQELNYSSDIDLVFVHHAEGRTQGCARPVDCLEYCQRLGEELIGALEKPTADGRCYRVDMRLRPHGRSGPLVMSLPEVVTYLQSEGRTWERQAWLKARAVAGDLALGRSLLRQVEPFVFQRYLSLDAIGDIQALKRQIELSVQREGKPGDEVKLGRGGIRDIEFTVQFLQLHHGGQQREVRGANTLEALFRIHREALLTREETVSLEEAYAFLRTVEHRLQVHGDQQTHLLPADPRVRRRVARSLGYRDGEQGKGAAPLLSEEAFEQERQEHVTKVRTIFENHFANLFQDRAGSEGALSDLLLSPEPDLEALAQLLPHFGLPATPELAQELILLRQERLRLTNPSRTRKFFASLAPLLLKALAATGEPEGALRRFSRIAGSLGGNAVLYQSLHAHPALLRMICELAAWSEYLTEILVANPGLFDELIDALRTERTKGVEELERELDFLAGGGEIAPSLRAYRSGELLRIGVRDLIHSVPLEATQRELTDLATAILRAQLKDCRRRLKKEKGEPLAEDGSAIGFAVLGVGKFGGREMNIGSDLDVLFFYGEDGVTPEGFPAVTYFSELVQQLTRALQELTAQGRLYQLDARLRPNGSKGPLAISLKAFEQYWKTGELADWERLALTRTRFLAGDPGVGERAEHLIRTAVYAPLQPANLAAEVRKMRLKMEEHAASDDIKTGRGGLVDIEFLVQYLQLVHGPAFPPLRKTHTKDSLQSLLKFKKLAAADGEELLRAYDFFSRLANRVRIVHGLGANTIPRTPQDLRKLALRAQYIDTPGQPAEEQLEADYQRYKARVREIFERVVAGP